MQQTMLVTRHAHPYEVDQSPASIASAAQGSPAGSSTNSFLTGPGLACTLPHTHPPVVGHFLLGAHKHIQQHIAGSVDDSHTGQGAALPVWPDTHHLTVHCHQGGHTCVAGNRMCGELRVGCECLQECWAFAKGNCPWLTMHNMSAAGWLHDQPAPYSAAHRKDNGTHLRWALQGGMCTATIHTPNIQQWQQLTQLTHLAQGSVAPASSQCLPPLLPSLCAPLQPGAAQSAALCLPLPLSLSDAS
jgi:hypothetical protein